MSTSAKLMMALRRRGIKLWDRKAYDRRKRDILNYHFGEKHSMNKIQQAHEMAKRTKKTPLAEEVVQTGEELREVAPVPTGEPLKEESSETAKTAAKKKTASKRFGSFGKGSSTE